MNFKPAISPIEQPVPPPVMQQDNSLEVQGPMGWDRWPEEARGDPFFDLDLSTPLHLQLAQPVLPDPPVNLAPTAPTQTQIRPELPVPTQDNPAQLISLIRVRRSSRLNRSASLSSHTSSFFKSVFSSDNIRLNKNIARCMGVSLSDDHHTFMQVLELERTSLSQ